MEVANHIPCMNAGVGQNSYSNNSQLQKNVILKGRPFVEHSIKSLLSTEFPACISVADLGCSSGPNTLLFVNEVINIITEWCQTTKCSFPETHFFLNDLPDNDFNNVFKSLSAFYKKLKIEKGEKMGACFVSGRPGSFYERLFPQMSIHFVHSSYSCHWLSQVPKGIENNKGNIYMAKSSPPNVLKAYKEQFERDFSKFLSLRAEEILSGGHIVLAFNGRTVPDPTSKDCCLIWELLAKSLVDLVNEGIVEEEDVNSFNMPCYTPCEEDIREIVQKEGSFYVKRLEVFESSWDPSIDIYKKDRHYDYKQSAPNIATIMRAVVEPLLVTHFGSGIIEKLFVKYSENIADQLSVENGKHVHILVSLATK